jgi:His/Glu/Gln/Arg/opine family amino acid ABC transporter permease subunit
MSDMASAGFFDELWQARLVFVQAMAVTAEIAFGAILLGLALGFAGSLAAVYGGAAARIAMRIYVTLMRGVPPLVALFFIYYGVGVVAGGMSARSAGIAALTLFAAAQSSEIFRGAWQSIPPAQLDAAKAIGLPFAFRVLDVVLPMAVRRVLPSVVNMAVDMVKGSTLVAAIGAADLLLTSQEFAARNFMVVEIYAFCWSLYLILNLSLSSLGRWLEHRFRYFAY